MSEEKPEARQAYGKAVLLAGGGIAAFAALILLTKPPLAASDPMQPYEAPSVPSAASSAAAQPTKVLEPAPITEALRKKGYHECNPPDPIGLGPYTPFRPLHPLGHLTIPQRGGHTPDGGYDVVMHFHGASPARKTLVQVARGVAFVAVDRGVGSAAYSDPFQVPGVLKEVRRSIEAELKRYSKIPTAHIRHLALTAWSAGYGAINEILKHGDDGVDAVVLLDGLHAQYLPGARHDQSLRSVSAAPIAPTFRFAKKALQGDKIFVFTHSKITPGSYPSTELTAKLLLSELGGVRADPRREPAGALTLTSAAEQGGLRVWAYDGTNELTHCAHITLIGKVVRDVLEPAWGTPALDRSVPPTSAPVLGAGDLPADKPLLEGVDAAEPGDAAAETPADESPSKEQPGISQPGDQPPGHEQPNDEQPGAEPDKVPSSPSPQLQEARPGS